MQIRSRPFFCSRLLSGFPWLSVRGFPWLGCPPPASAPRPLCSGHAGRFLIPEQAKPFPSPTPTLPSAWNHLPCSLGAGSFSSRCCLLGEASPVTLSAPCLLPSHYLASLVACVLSVSSPWNGSFTRCRPGRLGHCRGLGKDALMSAWLNGRCRAVCGGRDLP